MLLSYVNSCRLRPSPCFTALNSYVTFWGGIRGNCVELTKLMPKLAVPFLLWSSVMGSTEREIMLLLTICWAVITSCKVSANTNTLLLWWSSPSLSLLLSKYCFIIPDLLLSLENDSLRRSLLCFWYTSWSFEFWIMLCIIDGISLRSFLYNLLAIWYSRLWLSREMSCAVTQFKSRSLLYCVSFISPCFILIGLQFMLPTVSCYSWPIPTNFYFYLPLPDSIEMRLLRLSSRGFKLFFNTFWLGTIQFWSSIEDNFLSYERYLT